MNAPVPPPPPQPPSGPSSSTSTLSSTGYSNAGQSPLCIDKSQLLADICKGTTLRKTITKERNSLDPNVSIIQLLVIGKNAS